MAIGDFDALATTTLKAYRPRLVDNIFNAIPLLNWLAGKGRVEMRDGGLKINVPLMYGKNTTAGSYDGYDPIDLTPQEGMGPAEYNWKNEAVSIVISGTEIRKNTGTGQLINLLKAKTQQAEMSLRDLINEHLFLDGTGNDSKDFLGLAAIVATDPTSGTLAGIDRSDATYAWWRNKTKAGTHTTNAWDELIDSMKNIYNSCSGGTPDAPDFIITDQTVFEGYEGLLQPYERFMSLKKADAGFQYLVYKTVPLTFDANCTAAKMFFLNSRYLKLVIHRDANFEPQPFVKPANQDAKSSQILVMGNLVCDNCRKLGCVHTID